MRPAREYHLIFRLQLSYSAYRTTRKAPAKIIAEVIACKVSDLMHIRNPFMEFILSYMVFIALSSDFAIFYPWLSDSSATAYPLAIFLICGLSSLSIATAPITAISALMPEVSALVPMSISMVCHSTCWINRSNTAVLPK